MSSNKSNEAATQSVSTSQAELKTVKLEDLKPHPNLRGLYTNDSSVSTLRQNIEEQGLIHRIIVNKNLEVLSGNRRLRALTIIGFKETTVEVVDIPDEKVLEYGISVNQSREKTIVDERNEIMKLFEKYSEGQGKSNGGANTIQKISNITGMSTYKISSIRSIEEYAPNEFEEIVKGKSLNAALDVAMTVKKRQEVCKKLNKEYQPAKEKEKIGDLFTEEMKELCKKAAPEYVELIEKKIKTPAEAFNEVVLKVDDRKRKKVEEKHECPFCQSKVESLKIQKLLNLGADQIDKILQDLKERELVS